MDLMNFLLDRTIARKEGVTDEEALNRIALLGSLVAQSNALLSLLLVQKLARDEVASRRPPVPPAPPAVPRVAPLTTFEQAAKQVESFGFSAVREDLWSRSEPMEVVIAQDPGPFSEAAPGTAVRLVVARLEESKSGEPPILLKAKKLPPPPEPVPVP